MINQQELHTICAALQYWEEEMCPHGMAAMQSYLPAGVSGALSAAQVHALRRRLQTCEIAYATIGASEPAFGPSLSIVKVPHEGTATNPQLATVLIPRDNA